MKPLTGVEMRKNGGGQTPFSALKQGSGKLGKLNSARRRQKKIKPQIESYSVEFQGL